MSKFIQGSNLKFVKSCQKRYMSMLVQQTPCLTWIQKIYFFYLLPMYQSWVIDKKGKIQDLISIWVKSLKFIRFGLKWFQIICLIIKCQKTEYLWQHHMFNCLITIATRQNTLNSQYQWDSMDTVSLCYHNNKTSAVKTLPFFERLLQVK